MKALVNSTDGTKIAYDKTGHGEVVILVLGALNSRKSGSRLAKLLSHHFTVISYDRRGRGDSSGTVPYSPHREIEDIASLIDVVKEPVYLYGHSSGGALALQAGGKLQKQIRKLAIYEAPYSANDNERRAASEYYGHLKKLLNEGKNDEAVTLFIRSVGVSDKQIRAIKQMPMWRGLVSLAPTLAYESEVMGEGNTLPVDLLKSIKIPTLVMHGGAGTMSMRDSAQAISEYIPHSQFRTLAGQTHGVSPKVLAPVLIEFFSDISD
jgi:pimeloyl-ACP methyl ester carboxylesterase